MASTGLLNINPYDKGVVFDISSKPTNLAVQLIQKEAIKRDALEKYYMDYEKSLSQEGMRPIDKDAFLGKVNDFKSYYLKNRDCILNPSKCGAEAQSIYLNKIKDAQGIIAQSKQALANDKVDIDHFRQAQKEGLDIPEGYMEDVSRAHLPINHPQYKPLDAYKWNFFKPHNDVDFNKSTWGLVKPTEVTETVFEKDAKGKNIPTQAKDIITLKVSPQDTALAEQSAINYVHQNPGTYNLVSKMLKDPIKKAQLENVYTSAHPELIKIDATGKIISKPTISNIEQAAAAYAHLFNPAREKKEGKIYNPLEWKMKADYNNQLIQGRSKDGGGKLNNVENTIRYIDNGLGILQGNGDENAVNDYFRYWKSGEKGVLGGSVGFKSAQKVAPGIWKFNYNISKDGVAIPTSTTIDVKDAAATNQLYALHQQFLGSNAKAEAAMTPTGMPTPKPAAKTKSWAERQAELKNKKK